MDRLLKTAAIAAFAALLLLLGGISPPNAGANPTTIYAKALIDHECNDAEWHFIINQIDVETNAPASIHVVWANGNSEDVPLEKFTGGVAHYTTTSNLDSTVTSASAQIYAEWGGEFNLSHGPCGQPTETPTDVPTETPTDVPTETATNTPTETESPTETPTATETPTVSETPGVTETPADTETPTDVPTETATNTPVATATPGVTTTPPVRLPDTGGGPQGRSSGNSLLIPVLLILAGLLLITRQEIRRWQSSHS